MRKILANLRFHALDTSKSRENEQRNNTVTYRYTRNIDRIKRYCIHIMKRRISSRDAFTHSENVDFFIENTQEWRPEF